MTPVGTSTLRETLRETVEAHEIDASRSGSDGYEYVRCACGEEYERLYREKDRAVDLFFAHQSDAILAALSAFLDSHRDELVAAGVDRLRLNERFPRLDVMTQILIASELASTFTAVLLSSPPVSGRR